MTVHAPFTQGQVDNVNRFQRASGVHHFTCGSGNRQDKVHTDSEGVLVATTTGMICPFCDYKQNWVHDFMLEWTEEVDKLHREFLQNLGKNDNEYGDSEKRG